MKLKYGFCSVVLLASAISAFADTRNAELVAQDGTRISINWSTTSSFGQSQGTGSETAQSVEFILTTTPRGSQAVLLNLCRNVDGSQFTQTFKCNFQGMHDMSSCSVTNIQLSKNTESMGDTTQCSQQIAVVMQDGSWLVDPVNGTHNFNFSLR